MNLMVHFRFHVAHVAYIRRKVCSHLRVMALDGLFLVLVDRHSTTKVGGAFAFLVNFKMQ